MVGTARRPEARPHMGKSRPEAGGPHLRIFRDKRESYCPDSGPAALEAQRCGFSRHEIRRRLIEPHHDLDAALGAFARPAGRMRRETAPASGDPAPGRLTATRCCGQRSAIWASSTWARTPKAPSRASCSRMTGTAELTNCPTDTERETTTPSIGEATLHWASLARASSSAAAAALRRASASAMSSSREPERRR